MSRSPLTYEHLARAVAQEGSETCFALLGDANMNWAAALAGLGTRMVYVRHEHNAVAAAMAWARKTGKVGLATVTCGPGLTQLMTALPAAVRARLPLVVFAGEAPLKAGWYNQAIDQAPFVKATGADYHALHWPDRMPTAIRDAFLQARTERRPVVLGVPLDLQDRPWTGAMDLPAPSLEIMPQVGPMPPNPGDIAAAVPRIAEARRIVIMAGLGAVEAGAGQACRALAERLDALLATTLPARGLFHDEPFSMNVAGGFATEAAWAVMAEADLVIAVGTSLAQHNSSSGQLFPAAKVLQIDTDPRGISQGRRAATAHIRADARLGVEALSRQVPARPAEWRTPALAKRLRDDPADSHAFPAEPGLHDPRAVIAVLEGALPQGWEMVNSSGHVSFYATQMPSRAQDHFLTIREFGAIGNGLAFAMGVAAARPETPVVLFDGDGSVMMHLQELETIRRHGMRIAVCILNDGAYGSEIHKLRAEGLSDAGAVFGRPDFGGIARSLGLDGATVSDLTRLPDLVAAFAASDRAAVWDFPISDRVVSPVIRRSHPPGGHT